jgi:hypothetical protein
MVKQDRNVSISVVNGMGAALVAVCLVCASWVVIVRTDQVTDQGRDINVELEAARQDLVQLRESCDRQRVLIAHRERELKERGKLPSKPPVEAYFQALARLTALHGLNVRAHRPSGQRTYPGLVEQRFAYELTGPVDDLVRFLAAMEQSEYWCDVSYLSLEEGASADAHADPIPVAQLTISMFYEPETKSPQDKHAQQG